MVFFAKPSFPTISPPPPQIPAKWLPKHLKNLSDTLNLVTNEVNRAIGSSRLDTATGSDEVTYHMVAGIHRANYDLLPRLFSELFYFSVFPSSWKHAKCIPIPKHGKTDGSDHKNHRPISLLSCLIKVYKKILAARLAHLGKETGPI